MKKSIIYCVATLVIASFSQATDIDLEDINFPFNSKTVVDDLKQLPRLAKLLNNRPELILEINGHTDYVGAKEYNMFLSLERAKNVKQKLIEHGVDGFRIKINGYGKDRPKSYSKSIDGQFINRRAEFNVYAMQNGKKVYYYKDNYKLKDSDKVIGSDFTSSKKDRRKSGRSSDHVYNRGQSGGHKYRSDNMSRSNSDNLYSSDYRSDMDALNKKIDSIHALLEKRMEEETLFSVKQGSVSLGGGIYDEDPAGSGEGKFLLAPNKYVGFQGGMAALMAEELKDFQFDIGIIGNVDNYQFGVFGSTKIINVDEIDDIGNVSQYSLMANYLFKKGSVGTFYSKRMGSIDNIQVEYSRDPNLIITDTYLKVRDKFGLNFDVCIGDILNIEGEAGIVKAQDDEFTGRIKVGVPLNFIGKGVHIFAEASFNNTLIHDSDDLAIIAGIELGNWFFKEDGEDDIRPMAIPAISYEMMSNVRADNLTIK